MLCSMCQHGTTQHWNCTECGERHCKHIRSCSCSTPEERAAWHHPGWESFVEYMNQFPCVDQHDWEQLEPHWNMWVTSWQYAINFAESQQPLCCRGKKCEGCRNPDCPLE